MKKEILQGGLKMPETLTTKYVSHSVSAYRLIDLTLLWTAGLDWGLIVRS